MPIARNMNFYAKLISFKLYNRIFGNIERLYSESIKTFTKAVAFLIRQKIYSLLSFGFLIWTTSPTVAFAQLTSGLQTDAKFTDDMTLYMGFGSINFHGDFDTKNVNPSSSNNDITGMPFGEGVNFSLFATKPLPFLNGPDYKLKAILGVDVINFNSAVSTVAFVDDQITPTNINNLSIGPILGVGFEYLSSEMASFEPYLKFSFAYHNPQTNAFYRPNSGIPQIVPGFTAGPYNLIDLVESRSGRTDESYSNFIMSITPGFRYSRFFLGNYRWFVDYSITQFLGDYFDNTSAVVNNGADTNDQISRLQVGITYPLNKEKRTSLTAEKKRVRIDRQKIAKIERIQNVANLITTDEDLQELQKILSDKILLYDTPGIRFNELASKCVDRRVQMADSDIMTEMVEVPGGSYIIGLTAVDELEVQVQGRKRITINPFLVDKYEVTNEQYRAFLIAMGSLPQPIPVDSLSLSVNYGTPVDWQVLLQRAGLEEYANHARPIQLNGPQDLMPDDSQWSKYGLSDVIPWETYFFDPFYDNYPIVCVNYYQAKLFSAWAGKRLLTESEWEYIARSGVSGRVYPWDGLDVVTKTGKFRANFKQGRGVYDEDGYAIMAPVDSYLPNDFGVYNMAGNVSEWVLDSWNPSYVVLQNVGTSNFVSPYYQNDQEPRKIHRGGSWQSTKFYIGVGVRNFQDKNVGSPFVGFRCGKSVTRNYR